MRTWRHAKYRTSSIIQGWHEYLTLRGWVENRNEIGQYDIGVASTVYVNRQNTDRPEEWHLPTDQQQAAYVAALSLSLKRALQAFCPAGRWRDAETFECTQ